jgi:hypothetical protein
MTHACPGARATAVLAAAAAMLLSACSSAPLSTPWSAAPARSVAAIPTPRVSGPVASDVPGSSSRNYTFFATDMALSARGYVEEEFFVEGRANVYDTPLVVSNPTLPPTRFANVVKSDVPYRTRVVVRRPADPSRFNGTVVVEWVNVTDGFDGEYFWVQSKDHLLRKGYAYVALSAQDSSISVTPLSLKKFSPARYGSIDVTGGGTAPLDGLSYDIFAQASQAVRNAPALLGGMPVRKVIGVGMSQSGLRLGVYLNYLHMRAPVYDAFLIQVMNPALRDDLATPVIKVLSETEATPVQLSVAQDDTPTRRSWWVAGASHGDTMQRVGRTGVRIRDLGLANTPNDSCAGATTPMRSRVPLRHVLNAAVESLQLQITRGTPPPSAPPLATEFRSFAVSLARDEHGNGRGGVRLAHVEVPTARTNGQECGAPGAWVPFDDAKLAALYPSHAAYVARVKAAVDASVKAGFVLPEDAAETIAEAEASVIGTGLACGPLCLDAGHFRPDFASTGLLREHTVYYNPVGAQEMLRAADEAHQATAAAYSQAAGSPQRREKAAAAVAALRGYIALVAKAQADKRLTATAADLLTRDADNIIRGLQAL